MAGRICVLALAVGGFLAGGCGGGGGGVDAAPTTTNVVRSAGLWSAPVTLAGPAPPPEAVPALRADGGAIAAWAERRDSGVWQVMAAERDAAGAWHAGVPISETSATPLHGARVVVGSDGLATAVWALWDRPGGQVYAYVQAAHENPDGTWGTVQTLSRGTNGINEILAAPQGDGDVMIVWSGSTRRNGSYHAEVRSALRSASAKWTLARVASSERGDPFLAEGGLGRSTAGGGFHLIWSAFNPRGGGAVLVASSGANGRWATPRVLETQKAPATVTAASGPDGVTTATWRQGRQLRIVRSARSGWSSPRSLLPAAGVADAVVAAGPAGSAVIVVERAVAGKRTRLDAIRVQGDGFVPRPEVIARGTLPASSGPSAAIAADGTSVVTWTTARSTPEGVVQVLIRARLDHASGAGWGPAETVHRLVPPEAGAVQAVSPLGRGSFQVRWQAGDRPAPVQSSSRG